MERWIILVLLLLPSVSAAPGGVTEPHVWLRADRGITTSGSTITAWQDQTLNISFNVSGDPQLRTNALNFNPYVEMENDYFDGNKTIGFREVFIVADPNNDGTVLGSNISSPASTKQYWLRIIGNKTYIGDSDPDYIHTTNNVSNGFALYNNEMVGGATGTASRISINGTDQALTSISGNDPLEPFSEPPRVGRGNDPLAPSYLNGSIAEIIVYNKSLTTTERNKVHTYLGLKYGITVSTDYLSSDGTTLYDDSTYAYNIVGVGRDDESDFNQTNSTSMGDIVIARNATLDEGYFLIWANDNNPLTETTTNLPLSSGTRLNRTWKVNKTGNPITTLQFNLSGLSITGSSINDFNLYTDTDETFLDATRTPATSYSTNVVTFSDVNFTNGYFILLTSNDTLPPSFISYTPSNTEHNVSEVLLIQTELNETFPDTVVANISYPNSTINQITLNKTGNVYNTTFTVPILGIYNITFIANDSSGNTNTTMTNFTAVDNIPPSVIPSTLTNQEPNISTTIVLQATITDNVGVTASVINITYPNSTIYQISLNNPSGNIYNTNFTIPNLTGVYTVLFIANDTTNTNATETLTFTGTNNTPPRVASVQLNSGTAITLLPNQLTTINGTATIVDDNTCQDITGVTAILYRTNTSPSAPDNNRSHYSTTCVTRSDCSGQADKTETFDCSFSMTWYADPTDPGSHYQATNWTFTPTPSDNETGNSSSDVQEVNSLTALRLPSTSLYFGTIALGTHTNAINQNLTVQNVGNEYIDIQVASYGANATDGTAMICEEGSVPEGYMRYNTTPFTYSTGINITNTASEIDLDIAQGSDGTPRPQTILYFGFGLPAQGVGGMCNGVVPIIAVSDPGQD